MIYLDGRGVTRDEVLRVAQQAATGFEQLGVSEGDTVALLLRNDFAFFEVQQAAAAVGAYGRAAQLARPHGRSDLRARRREAEGAGRACRPSAPIRALVPAGIRVFVVPTPPEIQQRYGVSTELARPYRATRFGANGPSASSRCRRRRRPRDHDLHLRHHRPSKGVKRQPATPEESKAYVELFASVYGLKPGVRALVCGPLYHASPNGYGRQALMTADVLVLQSKFDQEETLALIEKHRIDNAVMVPTMFVRMLKLPPEVRNRYDVRSLRWVTHRRAVSARGEEGSDGLVGSRGLRGLRRH